MSESRSQSQNMASISPLHTWSQRPHHASFTAFSNNKGLISFKALIYPILSLTICFFCCHFDFFSSFLFNLFQEPINIKSNLCSAARNRNKKTTQEPCNLQLSYLIRGFILEFWIIICWFYFKQ